MCLPEDRNLGLSGLHPYTLHAIITYTMRARAPGFSHRSISLMHLLTNPTAGLSLPKAISAEGWGLINCHSSSCPLLTDVHAGMGPQGYAWPPPNMMPPNMQTDPGFRPSVAMDPSMIPPYYGTGVPQQQQWQPQSMPVSQGLPQTQSQSEQAPSQQMSAVQQQ